MIINENETGNIIKACFEVHNELGHGFLEAVYQEALEEEFKMQGIPYEREKLLPVFYKGKPLKKEYYADFICYDKIIVELKSVSVLSKPHKAQVLNYLNAAKKRCWIVGELWRNLVKMGTYNEFQKRKLTRKIGGFNKATRIV